MKMLDKGNRERKRFILSKWIKNALLSQEWFLKSSDIENKTQSISSSYQQTNLWLYWKTEIQWTKETVGLIGQRLKIKHKVKRVIIERLQFRRGKLQIWIIGMMKISTLKLENLISIHKYAEVLNNQDPK